MHNLKLAEEREYSNTQQQEINNLKMDITILWKQEEKYWGQRSRVKWLKFGDKNTAFFHASTIQRRDRNMIERLKDTSEECKIPIRLTKDMNRELMKEVSDKEIKEATFSLGSLKAPGPDGLNSLFFQKHWGIIEKEVSYKIKINGILSRSFVPQRGLRQGDPLSPYLFIIAAEVFTILMDKAKEEGRISGVRIAPTASAISHLLFANDCIIFSKDSEEEVLIKNRVEIEEILGLSAWDQPGKYHGLPAQWGRSKNKALRWIEERVSDKLCGWKEKLLTQSEREFLIKSVIQAIPAYAMNVGLFPKGFYHRLCQKVAKFWWASTGKDRGIYWRSWDKICASKRDGGIGFKNFYSQNIARLAKQAWRVFECPNAVWVQVLKVVYFPNEDFKVTKAGKGAYWIWKSIVHGKDFLLRNGRWLIGNAEKMRILEDNWILNMKKSPDVMNDDVTFVKELISEGQGWNINELRKHFDGDTIGKIIRTPVSVIGREDKFSWPLKTDGKYTIKTGYHVARKEQHIDNNNSPSTSDDFKDLWRDIWKLKVPQKIRTFLWNQSPLSMRYCSALGQGLCGLEPKFSAVLRPIQSHILENG
nr:uncharacterized protein LOC112747868 [Arachis hypogaea]